MKTTILIISLFTSIFLHGQNRYYFGYQEGFKKGCQCNDLPTKNVALINGTYESGLIDGKLDGLLFNQKKSKNSDNVYNTTTLDYNVTKTEIFNYDLLEKGLLLKQHNYSSNVDKVNSKINSINQTIRVIRDNKDIYAVSTRMSAVYLIEGDFFDYTNNINSKRIDYSNSNTTSIILNNLDVFSKQLLELISQINSENKTTTSRINQLFNLFGSQSDKRVLAKNGWHDVYATDGKDFCEIRKVYVENNRIIKYVIDESDYKSVIFTNEIKDCKATIKLDGNPEFTYIYFINLLSSPNDVGNPPRPTGTVSFWKNFSDEDVEIYVDIQYIGLLDRYFTSGTPLCSQDGTVTFKKVEGTFSYLAKSKNRSWSGVVTILPNECQKIKLQL